MLRFLLRVLPKLHPTRILLAAAMVISVAAFANASAIYIVNVTLGPSNSELEGLGRTPISGGSITGSFSADLPITGTGEISAFDFTFDDASGNLLGTLSSSDPGDSMLQSIITTGGCFNTSGGCDSFTAGARAGGGPNFQFIMPLGFTGGDIVPIYQNQSGAILSDGAIDTDTAGIVSGTILPQGAASEPVPEPTSLVLFATGLLPFLSFCRKRRFP
jgi:hypothetical protein